ncbi:hypothetical protein [Actinoplanes solisilvae]|uniref:hypothetical protein n=1 Tax=Actinoplanes solisilvae TaxID=2486853 RepID=UPI000FDC16BB|nr:hypothetical protein [Actinoplanes solisilvae]
MRWRFLLWSLCVLAGAALMYLPIHTHQDLRDWAVELRRTGVPTQAYVFDQITVDGGTTMYLRFETDGVIHEDAFDCESVCVNDGATTPIWYNAADPGDFVTGFGRLSGDRGRIQGILGVAGFFLALAGVWAALIDIGTAARFRRLVVVIGRAGRFTDRRPHRWAPAGDEAIALLEELRGRRIHELWLDPDWPVVEWLQEQAYAGPRPDVERIILDPGDPDTAATVRALEHWAYEVQTRPGTELVR